LSQVARCIDIGKFRLHGAVRRECTSGQWLGVTPKCEGLSQNKDYAREYNAELFLLLALLAL